jgi:hypothetical protein
VSFPEILSEAQNLSNSITTLGVLASGSGSNLEAIASAIAGGASWGVYNLLSQNFVSMTAVQRFAGELGGIAIASAIGLTIFGAIAMQMKIPEIQTLTNQIKRRFSR